MHLPELRYMRIANSNTHTNTQYKHTVQIHNIFNMFEIAQVACTCMLAIASSAKLQVHTMLCTLFDSKLCGWISNLEIMESCMRPAKKHRYACCQAVCTPLRVIVQLDGIYRKTKQINYKWKETRKIVFCSFDIHLIINVNWMVFTCI